MICHKVKLKNEKVVYSSYYEERELGWNDRAYHDSTKQVDRVQVDGIEVKIGRNEDGSQYFSTGDGWWETQEQAIARYRDRQKEWQERVQSERNELSHTLECESAIQALGLADIKTYVYNKDFVSVWAEAKKQSQSFSTKRFSPAEVAEQVKIWVTTQTKAEKAAELRKAGKPIPKHLRVR